MPTPADVGRPVVFCSHASTDKPTVEAFATRLRADGFDAWVDKWEMGSGDDLVAQINAGLERCTAGLVFLSSFAAESLWVETEVSALIYRAIHGLRLIPVLVDEAAPVPALLAPYLRRHIHEYEAIRDTLLGAISRPALGTLPERLLRELLIRLTASEDDEDAVHVQAWLGGEAVADETVRVPGLLATTQDRLGYRGMPAEATLTGIGETCGRLLFPGAAAARMAESLAAQRPGDRLDIVVEAEGALLGLPFETARLQSLGRELLVARDGVTLRRRPLGSPARLTAAAPGPLKLLLAVAAPEERTSRSAALDGERELSRIFDALPERSGAQAWPLETAGLEQITEALKHDQYHVLHLSGHGTPGGIVLETDDGEPLVASAEDLAGAVRRAGRPLPLVFVSCCDPVSGDHGAQRLGEALLKAGLDQVIAMQSNVSDRYATELARRVYAELASAPDADAPSALANARRELERERRDLLRRGAKPVETQPEYAAATLLCASTPQPLVKAGPLEPLRQQPARPLGGVLPELGIDDLIGRKAQIRDVLRVLRARAGPSRGAAAAGVALVGLGGVGKSTIAGRVAGRLAAEGWAIAAVAGPLDLESITRAVGAALDELNHEDSLRLARQMDEPADDARRVGRLSRALRDHRVLLVLDNFEDNLRTGGDAFVDDATGVLVASLVRGAAAGALLVTSRYPVPGASRLHHIDVAPLGPQQARMLLLRLPALAELARDEHAGLLRLSDGHPRLLELVDAVLRGNPSRLASMAGRLERLAAQREIDLSGPRDSLSIAQTEAVDLLLRDIALSELLALASPLEREALLQAAVSNLPINAADIAASLDDAHGTLTIREAQAALSALAQRTLVTPLDAGMYFVQRWTAQGLKREDDPERWKARNRAAARRRL